MGFEVWGSGFRGRQLGLVNTSGLLGPESSRSDIKMMVPFNFLSTLRRAAL